MKEEQKAIDEVVKDRVLNGTGVEELTIRTGAALEQKEERVMLVESGNIKAPANYVEVIGFDKTKAVVSFSREKMEIIFKEHPRHLYGAIISGKLLLNPELLEFGINGDKIYSPKELADFLNMRRHLFTEKSECMKLIAALSIFKAKIETVLENNQDNKGNLKKLVEKRIEQGLPEKFNLKIPIFIGYTPYEFPVDICVDSNNLSIELWLESAEMNELLKTERDIIINQEMKRIQDKGDIVVIEN